MRLGLVDFDSCLPVSLGKKVLTGTCFRCGECCRRAKCDNLMVDPGAQRYTCKIYHDRPVRCALWPLPGDPIPDCCGFKWIEVPD